MKKEIMDLGDRDIRMITHEGQEGLTLSIDPHKNRHFREVRLTHDQVLELVELLIRLTRSP